MDYTTIIKAQLKKSYFRYVMVIIFCKYNYKNYKQIYKDYVKFIDDLPNLSENEYSTKIEYFINTVVKVKIRKNKLEKLKQNAI